MTAPKRLVTLRSSTAKLATGYVRIRITSGMPPSSSIAARRHAAQSGTRYDVTRRAAIPEIPEATMTTVETALDSLPQPRSVPR